MMRILLSSLLFSLTFSDEGKSALAVQLRGVCKSYEQFYKDYGKGFQCLFDKKRVIPWEAVNDDYCDCADGSDEPGTAACSYVYMPALNEPRTNTSSLPWGLPGFCCEGVNGKQAVLSFSGVNDGKCDYDVCCDGSDEWQGVGGLSCENRCSELNQKWRIENEIRRKYYLQGKRRYDGLVRRANVKYQDLQRKHDKLKNELPELIDKLNFMNSRLAEAQTLEENRRKIDAKNGRGKWKLLVEREHTALEKLKKRLKNEVDERAESESRVQELENILSRLKEEYNPNFNDEGVKRAVGAWEEFVRRHKAGGEMQETMDTDTESEIDEVKEEEWKEVEYEWEQNVDWKWKLWDSLKKRFGWQRELHGVDELKESVKEIDVQINNMKRDMKEVEDDLHRDYGDKGVFRSLKGGQGNCLKYESGEYEYELCIMGDIQQKRVESGERINLGIYTSMKWVKDEQTGLNIVEQTYENGMKCWNGPERRTLVTFECWKSNEIIDVKELEKCVYQMKVKSPVACGAYIDGNDDADDYEPESSTPTYVEKEEL